MGILDTNKVVPLERTITPTNPISIASTGFVGDSINTTGYKEALLYITFQNTSSIGLEIRGASKENNSIAPLLELVSVYDVLTNIQKIEATGVYIINLSNTNVLKFKNTIAADGGTFNYFLTLRQRSSSNDLSSVKNKIDSTKESVSQIGTFIKDDNVVETQSYALDSSGNLGDFIPTNGKQELLVFVSTSSGVDLSIKGCVANKAGATLKLKVRSIYDLGTAIESITSPGAYIVDLSCVTHFRFVNNTNSSGKSVVFTYILRTRNSYYPEVESLLTVAKQPKATFIKSVLYSVTGTGNKKAMSNINMSGFRFFVVRVRTMVSSSESGYVGHSFKVIPEWIMQQATGETVSNHLGILGSSIVIGESAYNVLSDWNEVMSPSLNLYVNVTDTTPPSSEQPVLLHIDLIGIR